MFDSQICRVMCTFSDYFVQPFFRFFQNQKTTLKTGTGGGGVRSSFGESRLVCVRARRRSMGAHLPDEIQRPSQNGDSCAEKTNLLEIGRKSVRPKKIKKISGRSKYPQSLDNSVRAHENPKIITKHPQQDQTNQKSG